MTSLTPSRFGMFFCFCACVTLICFFIFYFLFPFLFSCSLGIVFFLFFIIFLQTALVMAHVDMEESLTTLQSERDELSKKSEMCAVFEQGLVELRTMLEKEIEKGQDTQKAWEDLSKLHKK